MDPEKLAKKVIEKNKLLHPSKEPQIVQLIISLASSLEQSGVFCINYFTTTPEPVY